MSDREAAILAAVRAIPRGFVRAYGDVDPAAPRLVGRVLASTDADVPWHRVVRADGTAPKGERQLELLRRERVPMNGTRIDMAAARYPAAPPGLPVAPPHRWSLPRAIEAVAAADPAMGALIARVGPIAHRPGNPDGHFGALVRSIVFQQLAGAAAAAIHARVRALVPGPLDAAALARVPDADLRAAGLSANKLAALRDLSAKVLDGTVVVDDAASLPDGEIIERLSTVRGIGRWTAEMYLMFELRRPDVWPVDDLGVRQGYGLVWGIDPPPPRRLGPLGDRFRPYRSVAARYMWEAVALHRRRARHRTQVVPRRSAGLLLFRRGPRGLEVLLGHMGGPFWARRDDGAWSIPKGEYADGEDPLPHALREFEEEMGAPPPDGPDIPLGEFRQSGKVVTVFAREGDFDASAIRSNHFTVEWPPRSGRFRSFPEIDRAEWMTVDAARPRLVKGQVPALDALAAAVGGG